MTTDDEIIRLQHATREDEASQIEIWLVNRALRLPDQEARAALAEAALLIGRRAYREV